MSTPNGRSLVNPLYVIYGCFDTTGAAVKCAEGSICGQTTSTSHHARTHEQTQSRRPRPGRPNARPYRSRKGSRASRRPRSRRRGTERETTQPKTPEEKPNQKAVDRGNTSPPGQYHADQVTLPQAIRAGGLHLDRCLDRTVSAQRAADGAEVAARERERDADRPMRQRVTVRTLRNPRCRRPRFRFRCPCA